MVHRQLTDALVEAEQTAICGHRESEAAVPACGASTAAAGAVANPHVLLLDDEEAILLPTARYFRGLGWSVDCARGPEEGEDLIRHRHYELAFLDVRVTRFGGTGGLELLREIRRRDQRTSVIVLSAYVSPEVEAEARRLGAAAVLRKPQALPSLAHLALSLLDGPCDWNWRSKA